MRTRAPRALLVLFSALVCAAHGQVVEPAVAAEVLTPRVEAEPNEVLSLRLKFVNQSNDWQTVEPDLTVPAGWQVLVPAEEVTLEPGEARLALTSILIPADARAGSHTFPLNYYTSADDLRGEVLFTVTVPAVNHAVLRLLESPELVTADVFVSEFLLENLGNTPHEWALRAESNLNLGIVVEPATVLLSPGEAAEIMVTTVLPTKLERQEIHMLTVVAESLTLPSVQASARSRATLVPQALPATAALHRFPLTVRSSYEGGINMTSPDPGAALELNGSGQLADQRPGEFSVKLRLTPDDAMENVLIGYEVPRWSFSLGEQSFGTSYLTPNVNGFGVTARFDGAITAGPPLAVGVAAYDSKDGVGATAELSIKFSADTAASVSINATSNGLLASLGAKYQRQLTNPSVIEVSRFETIYGVRAGSGLPLGHGLEARLQVNEGPSFVSLAASTSNASFRRRDSHAFSVGLNSSFRMNEALGLLPHYPLNLSVEYANSWAWNRKRTFALLPPARADATTEKYGVGLSLAVGRVSLSTSYSLQFQSEASESSRRDEARGLIRYQGDGGFAVAQSASWIREWQDGQLGRHTLDHDTAVALSTAAAGRLTASLAGRYEPTSNEQRQLSFSVRWTGQPAERIELDLGARFFVVHPSELWEASTTAKFRVENNHSLDIGFKTKLQRDGSLRALYQVAYSLPLHVPIGRRADIGRLVGTVATVEARPLTGLIVSVAGQAVTTNARGEFSFPAIPAGEHLVQVQANGVLTPIQILTPATPQRVAVSDGQTTRLDFTIMTGAAVEGAVTVEMPATGVGTAFRGFDPEALARGVRIELCNASGCLPTSVGADGRFRLNRLHPGSWTLYASHPRLPAEYALEDGEREIRLQPGQVEVVVVNLVPLVQQIEFSDGGTLTLPGSP